MRFAFSRIALFVLLRLLTPALGATVVFSRHRERVFSTFHFIMKPKRTHSKKPPVITNSRWLAYATAGAASAFTCAHSAEATIHYSEPINRIFNGCVQTATFRLDRRGDFIRLRHSSLSCGGLPRVRLFQCRRPRERLHCWLLY
jgi:hypothetical protein